jgi:uncharacterized protein YkwD
MPRSCVLLTALTLVLPIWADEKKDDKPGELKLSAGEQALIDLTNAERKKAELAPLKANPKLMEAARKHAENMAKQDKLEHVLDDSTRKTPPTARRPPATSPRTSGRTSRGTRRTRRRRWPSGWTPSRTARTF